MPRIYATVSAEDLAEMERQSRDEYGNVRGALATYAGRILHEHVQAVTAGKIIIEPDPMRVRR